MWVQPVLARGSLGERSDRRWAGEASLSLPPAGSLKRLVYSSSSSFPLGNWGQNRHVRVRTAVVPPFRKGSREKGDDYFGSLLPSLRLLFGLLLMPAGFSEEVGGKQEGEEEYKLLGHHPQWAGRAMSRNPYSYGALAIVLLSQLGETGSSQFRQIPLYCSPPAEEKECNTPQPSGSAGTSPAQRTCLISPSPALVSPSTGEKEVSPIQSLGQDERPLLPFTSRRDRNGYFSLRHSRKSSKNPIQLWTLPHSSVACWKHVSKPLYVQGPSLHPIHHARLNTRPPFYASYSEREGKTGPFFGFERRGSCMRKWSQHRKGALAQGSILLPGRLLHRRSTPLRQAVVQGAAMNRVTRPEEAVAGGEAGDCCTRRAAAQAVPLGAGYAQEAFCSLGWGLSRSWRGAPLGWRWCWQWGRCPCDALKSCKESGQRSTGGEGWVG